VLNVIPSDNIIASNQIEKFLNGERENLEYIYTLSADAAPAMLRLFEETDDENVKNKIRDFLKDNTEFEIPERWQRYNLAIENGKKIFEKCR
jgi:predicted metal-dependent hydrolase